jgi:hypothetical protein
VQGTLSTYLEFFINPEIAEVLCANEPTFSIAQIDEGKIVCIAMPQKFQSEWLYINTILKLSYYFHALSRFDTISALYSRGLADTACTLHALFLCYLVQSHATSCEDI